MVAPEDLSPLSLPTGSVWERRNRSSCSSSSAVRISFARLDFPAMPGSRKPRSCEHILSKRYTSFGCPKTTLLNLASATSTPHLLGVLYPWNFSHLQPSRLWYPHTLLVARETHNAEDSILGSRMRLRHSSLTNVKKPSTPVSKRPRRYPGGGTSVG